MKPFCDWPEIMTPADVQNILGIRSTEAYQMFKRADFPAITPGKRRGQMVGKFALRQWLNKGASITE